MYGRWSDGISVAYARGDNDNRKSAMFLGLEYMCSNSYSQSFGQKQVKMADRQLIPNNVNSNYKTLHTSSLLGKD
jgi:hypothetical protein